MVAINGMFMNLTKNEEFEAFCYTMWRRNCHEREDFNDSLLSLEEYTEANKKFLKKEFKLK
jgi:hypothetical protein